MARIYGSTNNSNWGLFVDLNETSYSVGNNNSNVRASVYLYRTNSASYYGGSATIGVSVNGEYKSTGFYPSYPTNIGAGEGNAHLAATFDFTVPHNVDGSKTVSMSMSWSANFNPTSGSASGSISLTNIPRQANLTAAPDFNDEQNPTITYSNPAGNAVSSLQACISLTGSTDDIAYRDISKTGTSYTFNLTDAERKVLRQNTTGSNSRTVIFYVKTDIGGNTFYSTLNKNFTVINNAPTLTPVLKDTGPVSTTLTGDNTKMIRYFNSIQATTGAAAKKEATISSQSITNGSQTISAASGNFNNTDNNVFKFKTTDSRGNSVTKTVTMPMVNYVPLTCNVDGKVHLIAADSTKVNLEFTVSGNYFNGSFGAANNSLTLAYSMTDSDGNTTTGTLTVPASGFSDNTYSVKQTITNLNYKNSYVITVTASDEITKNLTATSKVLKAMPVFDWNEDNFRFNVPCEVVPGISYFSGSGDNGGMWRAGREKALMKNTASNPNDYYPMLSLKTPNGVWTIGTIGERLCFHYLSDDDYNEGYNLSAHYEMVNGTNKVL